MKRCSESVLGRKGCGKPSQNVGGDKFGVNLNLGRHPVILKNEKKLLEIVYKLNRNNYTKKTSTVKDEGINVNVHLC